MGDLTPVSATVLGKAIRLTVLPMKPCGDRVWTRVVSRPLKSTVRSTSVLLPPDGGSPLDLLRKRCTLVIVEFRYLKVVGWLLHTWHDDTQKTRRHLVPRPKLIHYVPGLFAQIGNSELPLR